MANILTTKDEVKKYLEDIAATSSFDALLDATILGVSQRLELAANRPLFKQTRVELHNGGTPRIYVKAPPISSITSIVYASDYDFANGTTLSATEYSVDPSDKKNVIYSTFGVFIGGCESLKVTYIGGYDSADATNSNLPDMLKQAATMQVIHVWKNRKHIGFDNVNMGEGLLSKISNRWLLPEVLDVVKSIRYVNVY